jgi:hypothetical protein
MAKAIAKPPRVKYIASKFRYGKHAPELDILPDASRCRRCSPGQIMGKNCTLSSLQQSFWFGVSAWRRK